MANYRIRHSRARWETAEFLAETIDPETVRTDWNAILAEAQKDDEFDYDPGDIAHELEEEIEVYAVDEFGLADGVLLKFTPVDPEPEPVIPLLEFRESSLYSPDDPIDLRSGPYRIDVGLVSGQTMRYFLRRQSENGSSRRLGAFPDLETAIGAASRHCYDEDQRQLALLAAESKARRAAAYKQHFVDALAHICGQMPPNKMVDAWLAYPEKDSIDLQEWVLNHAPYRWMTGIGVVEAAEHMAENATDATIWGDPE